MINAFAIAPKFGFCGNSTLPTGLEEGVALFYSEEHQDGIILLFELVQNSEYFGVVGVFFQYPGFILDNAIGWQNGDKQILMGCDWC